MLASPLVDVRALLRVRTALASMQPSLVARSLDRDSGRVGEISENRANKLLKSGFLTQDQTLANRAPRIGRCAEKIAKIRRAKCCKGENHRMIKPL
jgi:hypothetical protein